MRRGNPSKMELRRISACALLLMMASHAAAQQFKLSAPKVPRPSMGAIGQTQHLPTPSGRPVGGGPTVASLMAEGLAAKQPEYGKQGPDLAKLAATWQNAVDSAAKASGTAGGGTWSINDVVKALQGGITKIADANSTIADPEVDPMAHAAGDKPPPAFDEFAGNMFCRHGVKLANCSGVNPCVGHKCFPGSMCLVDMCGACSAKCVSYAELGAGLNKVLGAVGLSTIKTDLPTPNLPVVDKLVGGVKSLTKAVIPKCPANTALDLGALRTMQSPCKPCPAGQISKEGDTSGKCGVCGKGRYADLAGSVCRWCGPGYFAPSPAGNAACTPCPADTFTDRPGQAACAPCAAGFGTRGLKGQRQCAPVAPAGPVIGPEMPPGM